MDLLTKLNDRLRYYMEVKEIKAAPLARRASLNESAVRDILRGRSKNPGVVTLHKIAGVLNIRTSELFETHDMWPVTGQVGEHDIVEAVPPGSDAPTDLFSPFLDEGYSHLAVLAVKSSSLQPFAYDDDYLVYDPAVHGVRPSDFGRPCLCQLETGERLVRLLRLGDETDRHHLVPLNLSEAPRLNVRILHAHRILFALPGELLRPGVMPTHAGSDALHEEQASFGKKK